jgi:hypothetical protein
MPGTGTPRRSNTPVRKKAIVGKSRVEATRLQPSLRPSRLDAIHFSSQPDKDKADDLQNRALPKAAATALLLLPLHAPLVWNRSTRGPSRILASFLSIETGNRRRFRPLQTAGNARAHVGLAGSGFVLNFAAGASAAPRSVRLRAARGQ